MRYLWVILCKPLPLPYVNLHCSCCPTTCYSVRCINFIFASQSHSRGSPRVVASVHLNITLVALCYSKNPTNTRTSSQVSAADSYGKFLFNQVSHADVFVSSLSFHLCHFCSLISDVLLLLTWMTPVMPGIPL